MTAQRRIVVLGGTGLLGEALVRALEARRLEFVAPVRETLDLADLSRIEKRLDTLEPSAVINTAAFTDVAQAELPSNRGEVFALNAEAPGRLAAACAALGVPLAHVSTDYVFDGLKARPYVEDDSVAPLQVYGRSKLEGERAVLAAHAESLVLRVSTLFGPGRRSRPHYVDAVLAQARRRPRLDVVRLPVSSPTYAPDVAEAMLDLLQSGVRGLFHVVNAGQCSRLELARETVRLAGLAERVEIRERAAPAGDLQRPAYSVLDTGRLARHTGRPMRPWDEALCDYLEQS
jgi:dTDP-4-dehydrorhamnose reductase